MKIRLAATALALAALAPTIAQPGVLYKSVDANGTITFSDTPPSGARILEERQMGSSPGMPQVMSSSPIGNAFLNAEQMLGLDPEVAHANANVDLAERELAAARRELAPLFEGARLRPTRLSLDDDARLEPYRKNLKIARQQLAEILRDRRMAISPASYTPAKLALR
jgi:hypothetical protein